MHDHQCHHVVVTGANAGLGYNTCKKLADLGVEKIILACRNEAKGKAAMETLVKETGKPASTFELVLVDIGDLDSCRKAVKELKEGIDGLICNAGGMLFKNGGELGATGATNLIAVNVLGHAVLIEGLVAAGKLVAGAHVVYAGSEAARGIPLMGLNAPKYNKPYAEDMLTRINGSAWKKYVAEVQYGYAKSLGTLYMSALARKHSEYVFVTMSPGGTTGTEAASQAPLYMRVAIQLLGKSLLPLLGMFHSLDKGTERYLSAVGYRNDGEMKLESGKVYASRKGKAAGSYVDQASFFPLFDEVSAQDAAYETLYSFIKD